MPRKANHIHKYRRTKLGKKGYEIYKCDIAGCTHFINPELLLGRISICHLCGQQFEIDRAASELAKPVCRTCLVERRQESLPESERVSQEAVTTLLDDLLKGLVPTNTKD